MTRIVIARPDGADTTAVQRWLSDADESALVTESAPDAAVEAAERDRADLVLLVHSGRSDDLDVVRKLWARAPNIGSIVIAAHGAVDRSDALRAGALDLVELPLGTSAAASFGEALAELARRRQTLAGGGSAPGARGTSATRGMVVAVLSAKGGVGRSFVAANLAACLAEKATTVLCDLDVSFADVSTWGVDGSSEASIDQLAAVLRTGELKLEDVRAVARTAFGKAALLPGPRAGSANWNPDAAGTSARLIESLARWYAWVIIDTVPGLADPVPVALSAAAMTVVVTGGDIGSVRATKRLLELLDQRARTIPRLVVVDRANRGEPRTLVVQALGTKEVVIFINDDRVFARRLVIEGLAAPQQGRRGPARAFKALAARIERAATRLVGAQP